MSRPIHVEESVTVARSPEVVWSVVADYGTDVEWRKGLTDMTPEPPGPLDGSRNRDGTSGTWNGRARGIMVASACKRGRRALS